MVIREEAQRNHDALFPDHESTLKVTDPELIEVFDNWAFGEVLKDGILDTRTRLAVQLAAIVLASPQHKAFESGPRGVRLRASVENLHDVLHSAQCPQHVRRRRAPS